MKIRPTNPFTQLILSWGHEYSYFACKYFIIVNLSVFYERFPSLGV